MSNSIFDQYQTKGLIPSIGGNDDVYQKLHEAAKAIAVDLKTNLAKILPYTLVAFDNQITEGEPVLEEVERSIKTQWQMLRSQFTEMPISLYRAVMLQALEYLVQDNVDDNFATTVYLSVIDVYPHMDISHKEQEILKVFLQKLGDKAEEDAIAEWAVDKDVVELDIPMFNLKLNKVEGKTDEETLKERLIAASGPQGQDGVARPNSNKYWSSQQQHWSWQFAPIAANGIAEVVNKALVDHGNSIDKNSGAIQSELKKYFAEITESIESAFQESIQSAVAVEQRSQLLWWKETLYSRKLYKSYRKLSKFECAIAMAIDLYDILPAIFPVSVDYILREAFGEIHGFKENEISLGEFLNQVNDNNSAAFLKGYFKNDEGTSGRTDLASFMQKVIYTKIDLEKEAVSCVGISLDRKISYEDISVWILHCFSVKHLTSN